MKSNRLWAIGTIVIVVAVVALGWVLGISPKLAEAATTSSTADQVDAENAALQQQIIALKAAYENIEIVRDDLHGLEESMPSGHDIPDFLRELSKVATDNAITLNSITLGTYSVYSPANENPSPAVAAAAAKLGTGNLVLIPVTLRVTGSDLTIINFTDSLQTGDDRLFFVTKFVVQSGASATDPPPIVTIDGEVQPPPPMVYTGEITGYIFVVINPNVEFEEPDPAEVDLEPDAPTPTPTPTEPTPTPTETVSALRR